MAGVPGTVCKQGQYCRRFARVLGTSPSVGGARWGQARTQWCECSAGNGDWARRRGNHATAWQTLLRRLFDERRAKDLGASASVLLTARTAVVQCAIHCALMVVCSGASIRVPVLGSREVIRSVASVRAVALRCRRKQYAPTTDYATRTQSRTPDGFKTRFHEQETHVRTRSAACLASSDPAQDERPETAQSVQACSAAAHGGGPDGSSWKVRGQAHRMLDMV